MPNDKTETSKAAHLFLRSDSAEYTEMRKTQYLEIKRKRDMPLSERKAELSNMLRNGTKKK
jgi:hypothetical protein